MCEASGRSGQRPESEHVAALHDGLVCGTSEQQLPKTADDLKSVPIGLGFFLEGM